MLHKLEICSNAQLRRVSKARPCPVCGGSHKCSLTDDGRAVLLVHHLRRAGRAADPGGAKRVLTAVGRATDIPPEWSVELDEEAGVYRGTDMGDPAALLTDAIRKALFAAGPEGLTMKGVCETLPPEWQRNERRLRESLLAGAGAGDWDREDRAGRSGGPLYRVGLSRIPAGEKVRTEGVLFDDLPTLPD